MKILKYYKKPYLLFCSTGVKEEAVTQFSTMNIETQRFPLL